MAAIDELAVAAACDERALHNVLGHLVEQGRLRGARARALRAQRRRRGSCSATRSSSLDGIGGRFAHAWSTLPTYVQTGRAAYAERSGGRSGTTSPPIPTSRRSSTR